MSFKIESFFQTLNKIIVTLLMSENNFFTYYSYINLVDGHQLYYLITLSILASSGA